MYDNVYQIHQKTTSKAAYIPRQIQIQSTLITAKKKPVTRLGIFQTPNPLSILSNTFEICKEIFGRKDDEFPSRNVFRGLRLYRRLHFWYGDGCVKHFKNHNVLKACDKEGNCESTLLKIPLLILILFRMNNYLCAYDLAKKYVDRVQL